MEIWIFVSIIYLMQLFPLWGGAQTQKSQISSCQMFNIHSADMDMYVHMNEAAQKC